MEKHIYIVGCGGVGSKILADLLRWNTETRVYPVVNLIDGDTVELKNLNRQEFDERDVGKNKATALKEKLFYDGFIVNDIPEYVNSDKMRELHPNGHEAHIVVAVDNYKSRKEMNEFYLKLDDAFIVSCGNEYDDGNVQRAIRKEGKNVTPDITCMHPEIGNPEDKSPLELSCEEEVPSSPQLVFANRMAAAIGLMEIYRYNSGYLVNPMRDTYFDLKTGNVSHAEFPEAVNVQPTPA